MADAPNERTPAARRGLTALVLLAGLVVGACLAGPRATRAVPSPGPGAGASPRPVDPWSSRDLVPLRITAADGAVTLTLTSDGGQRVDLRRQGTAVEDGSGRRGPWLVLELPAGDTFWRYRDRAYAGDLWVTTAPGGGLELRALLDLEEYVEGVVAAELILWSAPEAVLEAQAIAARSYAVANLDRRSQNGGAFLVDGVLDQAFRGRFEPDAASRSRGIDARLREAVARTRGRVLTFRGAVLDARFHAACGGATARPSDVFDRSAPLGHDSVPCEPCQASRRAILAARARSDEPSAEHADLAWSHTASSQALDALATRFEVGAPLRAYAVRRQDPAGRWLDLALIGSQGRAPVSFAAVREQLGWDRVRSAMLHSTWPREGSSIRAGLLLEGFGHGHGAGLCQRGATRHGRAGRDAAWILSTYYPRARIESLGDLDR